MHIRTALRFLAFAALSCALGCGYMDEPIVLDTMPARPVQTYTSAQTIVQPTDPVVAKRFAGAESEAPNAVQSAMMLSDKYGELVSRYKVLADDKMAIATENNELKKELILIEDELKSTRKELEEANAFMQEMYAELTQWKGDVLGFRDEMRLAQGAQLQALTKVLKLLGAELAEPLASMTASETRRP